MNEPYEIVVKTSEVEPDVITPEGWANWVLLENDKVYPHQIPEVLRPLHKRITQAVQFAIDERKTKTTSVSPKPPS